VQAAGPQAQAEVRRHARAAIQHQADLPEDLGQQPGGQGGQDAAHRGQGGLLSLQVQGLGLQGLAGQAHLLLEVFRVPAVFQQLAGPLGLATELFESGLNALQGFLQPRAGGHLEGPQEVAGRSRAEGQGPSTRRGPDQVFRGRLREGSHLPGQVLQVAGRPGRH